MIISQRVFPGYTDFIVKSYDLAKYKTAIFFIETRFYPQLAQYLPVGYNKKFEDAYILPGVGFLIDGAIPFIIEQEQSC